MKILLKNKLLKVVSVLLVFSVCFCSVSMDVCAADYTADFVGSHHYVDGSVDLGFVANSDMIVELGRYSSDDRYLYTQHVSGSFDVSFYNGASITPFDCNNINYTIWLNSPITSSFGTTATRGVRNFSSSASLIIAGVEYPIALNESNWLIVSTVNPRATHIVVRVNYEYDLYYPFTLSQSLRDVGSFVRDSFSNTFDISVRQWDVYSYTDTVSTMAYQVSQLVQGNAGIEGAINNQTAVIQQGVNLQSWNNELTNHNNILQQQANDMQAGVLNSANNAFAGDSSMIQSGISGFNNAEETLQNYSMQNLEQFNFDSGELASVGVGMVAAFTWISSFMEHLYTLTEFSPVFNIVCTLTMACVFLGFRRLWSGK